MKYIQIYYPKTEKKETKCQKFVIKLLGIFSFMLANPDYEKKIDDATYWLIEFEENENFPDREVGIDETGKVIAKMPYKKNYGFWTDTNMRYKDFIERFNCNVITEEYFNKKWNELQ
jgi:hypothetical protein